MQTKRPFLSTLPNQLLRVCWQVTMVPSLRMGRPAVERRSLSRAGLSVTATEALSQGHCHTSLSSYKRTAAKYIQHTFPIWKSTMNVVMICWIQDMKPPVWKICHSYESSFNPFPLHFHCSLVKQGTRICNRPTCQTPLGGPGWFRASGKDWRRGAASNRGQVIIALSEKHRSHIPYRNSMMTSVLRDSLGGNCMTTMIATLSLEKRNIDESISTCRFAQRVALIKNEAVLNEEIDPRLMIIRLQKEIQELKEELALVTGELRTEALTEAELHQLEKLIASFLEDQDPESRLEVGADMRKIHHCFHHLKKLLNDKKIPEKSTVPAVIKNQDCQEPVQEEEYRKLRDILTQRDNEINILVNMLKKEKKKAQDALHLSGMNVSELRHSKSSPFQPRKPEEGQRTLLSSAPTQAQDFGTFGYRSNLLHKKTGMREEMSLGRQEAFEIFKRDHSDSVTLDDNKQILKQRFSEAKALGESINEARRKIGHLKEELTQRHIQQVALGISEHTAVPPVPDPREETLRSQLEEEKTRYKTMFTRLKALKVEIEHLQLLMDKAKVKLQKQFEAWWAEEASRLQADSPAVNSVDHAKPCLQVSEPQRERSCLPVATASVVSARRIAPSPCASLHSQELGGSSTPGEGSTPRRPMSSIPLTGDSQTDSDILAFIKARQSILQKKCLGSN
nr:kinesin-like protein KIF6 isoform X4 [Oryctolagus cuniculus]XP_051710731.1 kinesin-like protein KIF6 isoform X4 [Oryctolagus cuniculus]